MKRQKRTTESLSREVTRITHNHYCLLSDYKTMGDKVTIKHNDCGTVYKVTPSHFIYDKRRCPVCSRVRRGLSRRKDNSQFNAEITRKYGNKYTLLTDYVKSNIKVQVKCNTCGSIFYITPNNFLRGEGCPHCGKIKGFKNETMADKEFKRLLNDRFNGSIQSLDTYNKIKNKIRFTCLTCGNVWETTPDIILKSKGCPRCIKKQQSKQSSKTINEFRSEVLRITNGEYKVVSNKYINNRVKVQIQHIKCGHVYLVTPHNFLRGRRCPFCRHSSLEENVADCLNKLHISYIEHAHMSWLKYNRYQHLDFYIPSKRIAIECDGQQHFEPVDFSGNGMSKAKQIFKTNRLRDKNKDILCAEHGIKILRIPYTKFPLRVSEFDDFLKGD